jgi:hypothetical protein
MKRKYLAIAGVLLLAGVAVLLSQATQPPRPLSDFIPSAPLLYLEARDFAALAKQWSTSNEQKTWLASANYQVFSRSRLFLRLSEAQQEFAGAAGLTPDMSFVDAAAGTNSALALYDIGNLEFLYVARMPVARAYETALWQSRAKFQPRKSAGLDYYVRQQQRRLAAFAVTNDLLLIATSEQAMASALALVAGQNQPAMKQEPWYRRTNAAQQNAGELRMVLNFDRIARTPYFRSYWVQRNTRDLVQFDAIISDLDRSPAAYRERRSLLRAVASMDLRPSETAVGEISRLVPADAGLFRAWAKPNTAETLARIQQIVAPRTDTAIPNRNAPGVGELDAVYGTEQDLETRIDEPAVAAEASAVDLLPVRKLLENNVVQAVLQIATSVPAADAVFVTAASAVAVSGEKPWDAAAVRSAFSAFDRLFIAANGRVLIVANSQQLLTAMQGRAAAIPVLAGATYAARFLHARELPNFQRMMTLMDYPALRSGSGDAREPFFFSENISSLGQTLSRVQTVFLESHDDGTTVTQNVMYQLQ